MAYSLIIGSSAMLSGLILLGTGYPPYRKIRYPVPYPLEHGLHQDYFVVDSGSS
jgi:hypothetical protein